MHVPIRCMFPCSRSMLINTHLPQDQTGAMQRIGTSTKGLYGCSAADGPPCILMYTLAFSVVVYTPLIFCLTLRKTVLLIFSLPTP